MRGPPGRVAGERGDYTNRGHLFQLLAPQTHEKGFPTQGLQSGACIHQELGPGWKHVTKARGWPWHGDCAAAPQWRLRGCVANR